MKLCTCSGAESAGLGYYPRFTQPKHSTLVTIGSEPFVAESPLMAFQSWLTSKDLFYVRNHFPTPSIDASTWSLSVEGQVSHSLRLTYPEIRRLQKDTVPVTLECAGNNRSDLDPPPPGNPFGFGAVSTAIWTGLSLKTLLERAGIKTEAKEVLFEGADSGEPRPGQSVTSYLRSLPLEVALHPDTLLAYEMNSKPLSREHGFPLRLIVPGWYAMASVKWLRRICVLDHSFEGIFQTQLYVMEDDNGVVTPLTNVTVKSLISSPQRGEVLDLQENPVVGLAWSGHGRVKRVEVSDDAGETWRLAHLVGPNHRYTWRQWRFRWSPSMPGHYTLVARAEDEKGNVQPMESVWNSHGYAANGVQPVCVTVR